MTAEARSRFRALLRGPWDTRDDARRKGAYLLRSLALERIAAVLQGSAIDVLLVKGAALARTCYAPPWSREMDDIDLLTRPGAMEQAVQTLVAAGLERISVPSRERSREAFHEVQLRLSLGAADVLVEVHDALDKLAPRPLDVEGLFARSQPVPGLRGLRMPAPEDHAVLVVLHAAGHELRHERGLLDLDRLLAAGLDLELFARRVEAARLRTATFLALSALRAAGSAHVPSWLVARFAPSTLRRRLVALAYDPTDIPLAKGPARLGVRWILRQAPLHDDLAAYARAVGRYAALRARESLPFGR